MSIYLTEGQEGCRDSGRYAEQVVHDVLVAASLPDLHQYVVKVHVTHDVSGPCPWSLS